MDLHIEIDGNLSIAKAHGIATELENKVRSLDKISEAIIHIEPTENNSRSTELGVNDSCGTIHQTIIEILKLFPEVKACRDIEIKMAEGKYSLSMSCLFSKDTSVYDTHSITEKIENTIKEKCKEIGSISIHQEPLS